MTGQKKILCIQYPML